MEIEDLPDPPAHALERAIGREVRANRQRLGMTVVELSKQAGLSAGMLSKIENGLTSPSLATLQALGQALNVPVTALFRQFEERRAATFVPAGQGLRIERQGTRAGHEYRLLGHGLGKRAALESCLITLTEQSAMFPTFQHGGIEFIHMLEGEIDYRHGDRCWTLGPGDSLYFDAEAPHGPETLRRLPARFLSVIAHDRDE